MTAKEALLKGQNHRETLATKNYWLQVSIAQSLIDIAGQLEKVANPNIKVEYVVPPVD